MTTSVQVTFTVEVTTDSPLNLPGDLTVQGLRDQAKAAAADIVRRALDLVIRDGAYGAGKPRVFAVLTAAKAGDVSVTGI